MSPITWVVLFPDFSSTVSTAPTTTTTATTKIMATVVQRELTHDTLQHAVPVSAAVAPLGAIYLNHH